MFMFTLLNHVKTYSLLFLIADTKRYLNCLTALRFKKNFFLIEAMLSRLGQKN